MTNEDEKNADWTTAYINSLPNSSFAVVEAGTDNKNARHLPHHGPGGGGTENVNLDLPHLRNALARANQIKPVTGSVSVEDLRARAQAHLARHKGALGQRNMMYSLKLKDPYAYKAVADEEEVFLLPAALPDTILNENIVLEPKRFLVIYKIFRVETKSDLLKLEEYTGDVEHVTGYPQFAHFYRSRPLETPIKLSGEDMVVDNATYSLTYRMLDEFSRLEDTKDFKKYSPWNLTLEQLLEDWRFLLENHQDIRIKPYAFTLGHDMLEAIIFRDVSISPEKYSDTAQKFMQELLMSYKPVRNQELGLHEEHMASLFYPISYYGGKARALDFLVFDYLPGDVKRVVDPMAGGGSFPAWANNLGKEVMVNDINRESCFVLGAVLRDYPLSDEELKAIESSASSATDPGKNEFEDKKFVPSNLGMYFTTVLDMFRSDTRKRAFVRGVVQATMLRMSTGGKDVHSIKRSLAVMKASDETDLFNKSKEFFIREFGRLKRFHQLRTENQQKYGKAGARIFNEDVFTFLEKIDGRGTLLFLDPPYDTTAIKADVYTHIIKKKGGQETEAAKKSINTWSGDGFIKNMHRILDVGKNYDYVLMTIKSSRSMSIQQIFREIRKRFKYVRGKKYERPNLFHYVGSGNEAKTFDEYYILFSNKKPVHKIMGYKSADVILHPSKSVLDKDKEPKDDSNSLEEFEEVFEHLGKSVLDVTPTITTPKWSLHAHVIGKGVHFDLRRQVSANEAVGLTLFGKGLSREPKSYPDAIKLVKAEIVPELKHNLEHGKVGFVPKAQTFPKRWLYISGKIEEGATGAGSYAGPSYMVKLDGGSYEGPEASKSLPGKARSVMYVGGSMLDGRFNEVESADGVRRGQGGVFFKGKQDSREEEFREVLDFDDFEIFEEMSAENPDYIDIRALAMVPEDIRGTIYTEAALKKAKLDPGVKFLTLGYGNMFHKGKELNRIGIIKRLYWDPAVRYKKYDSGEMAKGGLMLEATITNEDAVTAVREKKITRISVEEVFSRGRTSREASNIRIYAYALCTHPAVPQAEIREVSVEGAEFLPL